MKYTNLFLVLIVALFTLSCGDDKDEPNVQPTNNELSIEPYFKYVGQSLTEIQNDFSIPLDDNLRNFYLRNQWIYNQKFDIIFWVTTETPCSSVRIKRSDEKTTTFEHFKLFTKEAFSSLGEPRYTAVYYYPNAGGSSDYEVIFQVNTPKKKGAYEETISFAEKNNISKYGHACEMIWEKNNYKIRYYFSTELSELYISFYIDITKKTN